MRITPSDKAQAKMTSPEVIGFLPLARRLALTAAETVMSLLNDTLVRSRKADHSLVTNADHASNDVIRRGLLEAYPAHGLLSEETGFEGNPSSGYLWLVDPLDGTKAYAGGVPGFSVMVGLLDKGLPVLGVVVDPWEKHLYEAVKGLGAFHTHAGASRQVKVSKRSQWEQMPVVTSTGFPPSLRETLLAARPFGFVDPINSVGIKAGYLVRQLADIYVNHHPVHYWDTCAPQVILEEAGGLMTFWDGSPLVYAAPGKGPPKHERPTLATNGPRHLEICELLKKLS